MTSRFGPREILRGLRTSADRTTLGTISTGVMVQVALVVSGVIAARMLGPEDRGRLAYLQALAIAGAFIISLGLPTALAFWIAQQSTRARGVLRAVRGLIVVQLVLGLTVPLAVLVIEFSGADDDVWLAALISWPLTAVTLVGMYVSALLQGLHRFLAFNLYKSVPVAAYALVILLFWALGHTGLEHFVLAYVLISIVAAGGGVLLLRRGLPEVDGDAIERPELVRYGLKSQIGAAAPLESFQIDLLVVGAIGGPVVLGYYVGALAFTNLPRFVAMSIGIVAFPRVAARLGSGGAMRTAIDALVLTFVVLLAIVIPLELIMGWLVPFMFGDAFAESVPVARILLISAMVLGIRRVFGDVMRGGGVPTPGTTAEIISWVVYGAVVWPLIDDRGPSGAGLAMLFASVVSLSWMVFSSLRILRGRRQMADGRTDGRA